MYKLKILFRFVIWLVKRFFGSFGVIAKMLKDVWVMWRDSVREDFMVSLILLAITEIIGLVVSLMSWLIFTDSIATDSPRTAGPPLGFLINPLLIGLGIYFCVILSALYEVFIEEYERPFTILKDK
jgi:hypothetical protein